MEFFTVTFTMIAVVFIVTALVIDIIEKRKK